jgi:hypothetical protein
LLRLNPGEDRRLLARLGLLLTIGVDVNRLARQTALLEVADRELAGRYLVAVATAADPAAGPAIVAMLIRVYRILGLEPDLVFTRLHEQSTSGSPATAWASAPPRSVPEEASRHLRPIRVGARPPVPAVPARPAGQDEPVMVRAADPVTNGYALPWAATPPSPDDEPVTPGGVPLDQTTIMQKLAQSAAAATILTAIFDTDPASDLDATPSGDPASDLDATPSSDPASDLDATPSSQVAPQATDTQLVAGLDRAHSLLLRALAARQSWTREEFSAVAAAHGILPDGALDLLNEAAIDAAGAPVVEDDVTLAVNNDVLLELLA